MRKTKKVIVSLAIASMATMIPLNALADGVIPTRLGGATAEQTAALIADQTGWTDTAVLASSASYGMVDALTASPLATFLKAPILLTEARNVLNADTKAELNKLKVKTVYVTSGTAVISQAVLDELTGMGIKVVPLGGSDRFQTSVNIAKQMIALGAPVSKAAVAFGWMNQDALSISAIASAQTEPILLTEKDTIPTSVKAFLTENTGVQTTDVIGGIGVISDAVRAQFPSPTRVFGTTAYDTNLAVLKAFDSVLKYDHVFIANGETAIDALTGAPLAAKYNAGIVLTNGAVNEGTKYVSSKLSANSVVTALGGTSVVSDVVRAGVAPVNPVAPVDPVVPVVPGGGGSGSSSSGGNHNSGVTYKYVETITDLNAALADPNITEITFTHDITMDITVSRSLTINFGAYALTGNVLFQHDLTGTSSLTGTAVKSIKGNLTVDTKNASFENHVVVSDKVNINNVKVGTWTEYANGNTLTISDHDGAIISIVGSPGSITVNANNGNSGNLTINVNQGAIVSSITCNAPVEITVASGATVNDINVAAGAGGSTITNNGTMGTVTSDAPINLVANVAPSAIIAGASGSIEITGTHASSVQTVLVSAINVTSATTGSAIADTVVNGGTLQMLAEVTPANATNKAVTWSVATLSDGTAVIDASTGYLQATGVGTVTVTATNAASGVTGTKVITIAAAQTQAQTAAQVAAGITTIAAPVQGVANLTLPTVPTGFTVAIKTSSNIGVITTSGAITIPSVDTTVALVLEVTRTSDSTTASSISINVVVPAAQAQTAAQVAAGITEIQWDASNLTLPTVPTGFTVAIKTSSNPGVITTSGAITIPSVDTTVALVLEVTRISDATTASSISIDVIIRAARADSLTISGGVSSLWIPTSGSTTSDDFTVTVMDQYGRVMPLERVTWSLINSYPGVSVDPSTGAITLQNSAWQGTFLLVARSNSDTTLMRAIEITLNLEAADTVAPTLSGVTAGAVVIGDDVAATSNEAGFLYLVPQATVTTPGAIDAAGLAANGIKAAATAGVSANLSTANFTTAGTYVVYAIDAAGNVSTGSAITVSTAVTAPDTVTGVSVIDGADGYTLVTSPTVGQVIRANITLSNGTTIGSYPVNTDAVYKWYYQDSPDTVLGTTASYTVTSDNMGKKISVDVSVNGYTGTSTWTATNNVTAPTTVTGVSVIDGADGYTLVTSPTVGQVIRANITLSNGTTIGSYPVNTNAMYKWYYQDSPDTVLGTTASYTVTSDNMGKKISVDVSVNGYTGTSTWTATNNVCAPDTVTGVSVIDGADGYTLVTSPTVGQVIRANITLSNGTTIGSYPVNTDAVYKWYYQDSPDTVLGTTASYTVTSDNMGKKISVDVSVNGYTGTSTWTATNNVCAPDTVTGVSVIDGADGYTLVTSPTVGQVIRANITLSNGTTIGSYPVNTDAVYKWYYQDSPETVLGTTASYTVTSDNMGKKISVDVSVNGCTGTSTWTATNNVSAPTTVTGVSVIDGADGYTLVTSPTVGQVIRANITLSNGTTIGSYPVNTDAVYKWYYQDSPDTVLGTTASYTVTSDNMGKKISVDVSVNGYTGTGTWTATNNVSAPTTVTGVSVIDGADGYTLVTSPTVGQVIRANITLSNGTTIGSYPVNTDAVYKWYYQDSPDTVLGTTASYTVTSDNMGKKISVDVSVNGYTGTGTWTALIM